MIPPDPSALPLLVALLSARADGDADTVAELRDILGDPESAEALLEEAEREGGGEVLKAFRKAAAHAPAGGVTVQGKEYTGGQFIPGEVMENATAEERAKVEGGGGEKQQNEPSAKESRRAAKAADVAAQAAAIEVEDTPVQSVSVQRNDHDAIADLLDWREEQKLDRYIDRKRDEYVEDYDPDDDISIRDIAESTGWDDAGVRDKVMEYAVSNVADDYVDEAKGLIKDWYQGTKLYGREAIEELAEVFRNNDYDDDVVSGIEALADDADEEMESATEEKREELIEEKKNEYDPDEDRAEWLEEWYDDNLDDDRLHEGDPDEGRWGKSADGYWAYHFKTSDGSGFEANVVASSSRQMVGGIVVPEFMFGDDAGSFAVTGKGGAKTALEVFAAVTPAAVAILTKNDYEAMQFSAAEPSRQKLYDRLVRTTAASAPDYAAVAVTVREDYKKYMLVKRDKLGEYMGHIGKLVEAGGLPEDAVEQIVKASGRLPAGVEILSPATDDDVSGWNDESSWEDKEPENPAD